MLGRKRSPIYELVLQIKVKSTGNGIEEVVVSSTWIKRTLITLAVTNLEVGDSTSSLVSFAFDIIKTVVTLTHTHLTNSND